MYHKMPEKASVKKKKYLRKVNWFDIHWRNTELLADFINPAGKIKGRFQTKLLGN
jgi:ribosomal protein S18